MLWFPCMGELTCGQNTCFVDISSMNINHFLYFSVSYVRLNCLQNFTYHGILKNESFHVLPPSFLCITLYHGFFFFLVVFLFCWGCLKSPLLFLGKKFFSDVGCLLSKSLCSYEKILSIFTFLSWILSMGPRACLSISLVFLDLRTTLNVATICTKSWHRIIAIFRNRRSREASVLKAIENGAETLFDIVAFVYSEVDRRLWIPAASNVRLHVDHLALEDRLPEVNFLLFQHRHFPWLYIFTY